MGRRFFSARRIASLAASLLLAACTTHNQETPSLSGPSGLGTSLTITVSPDTLNQDGASQSLVQIQAYDSNGQPARSVSMRVEITVDGAVTDFGSLSAKNVVTDSNGRTSVVYTAPAAPASSSVPDTLVQIRVTPSASDFANATARTVNIRLTAPGVVGPPPSPLRADFVPPSPTVGNPVVFQATVVDATGADVTGTNQVASYQWNFGDGTSASGRTVSKTFTTPSTFAVTLTMTDALNRINRVTHTVTVGQGALPTATFLTSPSAPIVDQSINFNASGSTAEPGHNITDYAWNFGDGQTGSGAVTTHAYHETGTYVVTLKVTDDAGRKSTVTSQNITVGTGNPTADFTFNPSAPKGGSQVVFDASATQPAAGRTIVSYSWSFGDGGSGTGQTVTHTFTTGLTPTTYNVLLTVTDSAGKTSSVTKPITINP